MNISNAKITCFFPHEMDSKSQHAYLMLMSKEFCCHVHKLIQVSSFEGTVILRFGLNWEGLKTSNCI